MSTLVTDTLYDCLFSSGRKYSVKVGEFGRDYLFHRPIAVIANIDDNMREIDSSTFYTSRVHDNHVYQAFSRGMLVSAGIGLALLGIRWCLS